MEKARYRYQAREHDYLVEKRQPDESWKFIWRGYDTKWSAERADFEARQWIDTQLDHARGWIEYP